MSNQNNNATAQSSSQGTGTQAPAVNPVLYLHIQYDGASLKLKPTINLNNFKQALGNCLLHSNVPNLGDVAAKADEVPLVAVERAFTSNSSSNSPLIVRWVLKGNNRWRLTVISQEALHARGSMPLEVLEISGSDENPWSK